MNEACSTSETVTPYQVFLVLDPQFGQSIEMLLPHGPVWLIDSPTNAKTAKKFWAANPGLDETEGLTTFKAEGNATSETQLISVLDMVNLHHGRCSHDPPYTMLTVYGASLTEEVKTALARFHFDRFLSGNEKFTATRPLQIAGFRK